MSGAKWRDNKTAEELEEIARKSVATRRRNRAEAKNLAVEQKETRSSIHKEILALQTRLDELKRFESMAIACIGMTGKRLHSAAAIVEQATPWESCCGVYFLIKDRKVVYVGQSVNVFSRISTHSACYEFDSFAFVRCRKESLNVLESLYIYMIEPALNGRRFDGCINAPLRLDDLIGALT